MLQRFSEPAWNNPVIRFLDPNLDDLIPRKAEIWKTGDVVNRIRKSLDAWSKQARPRATPKIPLYLELIALEHSSNNEHATFAMHCYWDGEVKFGAIDGVKSTRSAMYAKREIVNVTYDPQVISYKELVQQAVRIRCASTVFVRSPEQERIARKIEGLKVETIPQIEFGKPAPESDQDYYLNSSVFRLVPMTEIQRTRVNAAIGARLDPGKYLSPQQVEISRWLKGLGERDRDLLRQLHTASREMSFNKYFEFVSRKRN